MPSDQLTIRGARQHNLRDLDLDLPKNSLIVFTGVSGSGKSSLAFDTIYAEGQRRYVESLSAYARQFLDQTPKPDVDHIDGLAPAISIEQHGAGHNPRSTVGTITEIYDYLRVLYAALGTPHCPHCRTRIGTQTREQIIARLLTLPQGARLHLLAPVAQQRKGEYRDLFDDMRKAGYIRARVDGEYADLTADLELDRYRRHSVEIVVDRGIVGRPGFAPADRTRLAEAVEAALELGEDALVAHWQTDSDTGDLLLSAHYACPDCGASFSFNSPQGMCPTCGGLGTRIEYDPELLVQHPDKSLLDGAIPTLQSLKNRWRRCQFAGVAKHYGFSLDTPFRELTDEQRQRLLYGSGDERIEYHFKHPKGRWEHRWAEPWAGIIPREMARYRKLKARTLRDKFEALMRRTRCPDCQGARLRPESLAITLAGRSIAAVCALSIDQTHAFFCDLALSPEEAHIAEDALKEIRSRLGFLIDVGLHYLTLERTAPTLSGGEAQRVRLAGQIGAGLTGVLYVLDEPTIGLHPRDNARLVRALQNLRDLGNTLITVEHDRDTLEAADYLVDFGPGAGPRATLEKNRQSLTGQYLSGKLAVPVPEERRQPISEPPQNSNSAPGWLTIAGARHNNLRDLTVHLPLSTFVCVTGPSGSGKSSLVHDILHSHLAHVLHRARTVAGEHDRIIGDTQLDKVIDIDQSPIGHSPRSDPATYTGLFDLIRKLYAQLPESRVRGYTAARFSYNQRGGRCEACHGLGSRCIEMHFLPDVWVECDGRRWHLAERTLADGSRPAWQPDALACLADQIAALDSLEPQWNARDHVTIKPAGQRAAFFLRARTDERWWFRVEFRTEKGLFDQADLSRRLCIMDNKTSVVSHRQHPRSADALFLWIDTRDVRDVHRATRFCHQFAALPRGGGPDRKSATAWQFPIRRAREQAPICAPEKLKVASKVGEDGYTLEIALSAAVLNGYDPAANPRLGFTYLVCDHEYLISPAMGR